MNWYNYVGSDPVNFVDPMGMNEEEPGRGTEDDGPPIIVVARKIRVVVSSGFSGVIFGIRVNRGGRYVADGLILEVIERQPQKPQDRCSGGRATFGLGGGLTFFLGDRGLTFNLEIGVAHGTRAGSGQFYVRGSAAALGGGGAFGAAGLNASGGITSAPLTTGYSNDKILAVGAAKVFGGELMASTGSSHGGAVRDPSLTGSLRGGYGGYLAAGDRHTVTGVLIGGC